MNKILSRINTIIVPPKILVWSLGTKVAKLNVLCHTLDSALGEIQNGSLHKKWHMKNEISPKTVNES